MRTRAWKLLGLLVAAGSLVACTTEAIESDDDGNDPGTGGSGAGEPMPQGLPILGSFSHDIGTMTVELIASSTDGLVTPRDIAFHPTIADEAWMINTDDSALVINDMGGAGQVAQRYQSGGANHFLANPAALAFGDNGNFATAHEEDAVTQPSTPADFMGPTLWSSDRTIFDGGHGGHLDMLHNSPNAMGIAWARGNAFWVFDGMHSSLTLYDFVQPHVPGGTDHSDGIVQRYVEGEVARVPNVSSHLAFDTETNILWVADTGNSRIAWLDTAPATRGSSIAPNYDGTRQYSMDGAILTTFIDTTEHDFTQPSGIELHDGHIFVTAADTATIYAFKMDTGELVDWLPTGGEAGSISGFAFDASGNLVYADPVSNTAVRISPQQ